MVAPPLTLSSIVQKSLYCNQFTGISSQKGCKVPGTARPLHLPLPALQGPCRLDPTHQATELTLGLSFRISPRSRARISHAILICCTPHNTISRHGLSSAYHCARGGLLRGGEHEDDLCLAAALTPTRYHRCTGGIRLPYRQAH